MDAMAAILTRRSVRSYSSRTVEGDQVTTLLKAAMAAPSAGNQQPWQFVIIDDRSVLDAIPEYHEYSAMLKQAPVAVAICGDLRLETIKGMWVQDCSAATQNLLLAAHATGLGAVWLGIYPHEERVERTKDLLGLPDEVIPLAIVAVGHPAETPPPADRFNESRIHRNTWRPAGNEGG